MKPLQLVLAVLALCASAQTQAVGGLADVRVFDRSDGRQLPVHWHQGQAYVVGTPGHEYRVTVRNRQGSDLLAVMSVDGVNVITGQTAHPLQSGYVIGPRTRLTVDGWRKSLERTAAFYFSALGDSYAARTGRPDNVGVIGVALYRRKAEPPQPFGGFAPAPRAESGSSRESADAAAPLGTGHGRIETSRARHVAFERASRDPAETLTLRYDSYRNLVAMGVIPHAARRPAAFPGFVPDA